MTFNVLHGIFCGPSTDSCRAPARAAMLTLLLQEAGCPEIVVLQEIGPRQKEVIPPAVAGACDDRYAIAWQPGPPELAQVMVLSTLPIAERGYVDLAGVPWEAYWIRVETAAGTAEVLGAHFASDFNNPRCTSAICPPVCRAGITTNQCHAQEAAAFFAGRPPAALQIVAGDLNAAPDSPTVGTLTAAGFRDAWLLAGHPDCGTSGARGCTIGRRRPDNPLDGLDSRDGRYRRRIDFVLARRGPECRLRTGAQTLATAPLAKPIEGLYWPSDHGAVLVGLTCEPPR